VRHKLDNGLTVLLQENHAARVVAFQAWVDAGSGDETAFESGLAHLHEHMLFKGTETRGVGEIARDVEAAGGDVNAWTSHDQTVYHVAMPSRDFQSGIHIVADALRHSTFDPGELKKEQEVVLEEIKRNEDMPTGRLSRHLFELAYAVHPYRRPVLGTAETVRGFSRDDVLAFYRKHYRPQKTTLVLVGDFDEADALEQIRALFADWSPAPPGEAEPPSARVPEPEPDGLRVRVLHDDVREAHLALAWPVPPIVHDDVAALDVLSVLLGHGESSRLITTLRRRRHVVNDAHGYVYAPKDPGLLAVGAQTPGRTAVDALAGLLEETYRLRTGEVTDEELEKAKTIIESDMVYQSQTVQGQARRLGYFECTAGALEFEERFYRAVRQVDAEDVQRVADTYLRSSRLVATALVPEGSDLDEATARRICEDAERAASGRAPAARKTTKAGRKNGGAEVLRTTLSSGAVLLVQPDRAVPLVSLRAVHVGGQRFETEENAGINNLAARLLTEGTATKDAERIARRVDGWAGTLSGSSGRNSFGMDGEFLSRHFEAGMSLFSECLLASTFPEAELEKERALLLEEIDAKVDHPAELAFDLFRQTLWHVHPYRMDVRGTKETLGALDAEAVRAYVARHYHPSRMHLAVVGDVDVDRAVELAEAHFGAAALPLPEGGLTVPEVLPEALPDAPRRAQLRLAKEQAHVLLGFPGVRLVDDDRFVLEVLSTVLSGQGGRLFVELRDRRSMAYSVTSFNQEGIDPGFFGVYIGCSPEKVDEAVTAIREELARLCDVIVPDAELSRAKRYLAGAHEIGLQRPGARASVMAFDDAYGLGHLAHRRYAESIEGVDAEAVRAVARRYLDPAREVLAIVGP
jgi:zinc protease